MNVTVTNPDAPFDSPAYDGPADQAHGHIATGTYPCTYLDAEDNELWGTLVVTDDASHLAAGFTDAYGNQYPNAPVAADVTVGSKIMLAPGTSFTVEDSTGYEPDEMDPAGTVKEATDINGVQAVYGEVLAVKVVGDRAHLTVDDMPCTAWTFSISASQVVYVA